MKSKKIILRHELHGYGDYSISFDEVNFDEVHDYNKMPAFAGSVEISKQVLNELGWDPTCQIAVELKLVHEEDEEYLPSVTLDGIEMSAGQARKILNDMLDEAID